MRICYITNLYPPNARGGAERVVTEEVRALKEEGHEVCVITAEDVRDDGSTEPRLTIEDGVRVYRFYPMNLFFYRDIGRHGFFARAIWHLWDLVNPSAAKVVRKILQDENPEIVHTHNLKGIGYSIPRVIRKLYRRHVHTVHDVQLVVPSGLLMKGSEDRIHSLPYRIYAWIMRNRIGSPDVVISPSQYLLRFYADHGFFPSSKLVLLPNPSPVVEHVEHSESKEMRFLFLGQIEEHKGVLWLISAMKDFFKKRPMSHLDIVGEGTALDASVELAGKEMRFTFFGKKRLSEFDEMFRNVDYTILPSLCYENAPTVIGESFAHGVPVIAAKIGGAAEMIRDGENGFVFEAGDQTSFMSVLERVYKEEKSWKKRSNAALHSADLRSTPFHASRLYAIYRDRDHGLPYEGPVIPVLYSHGPIGADILSAIKEHARKRRSEMRKKTKPKPKAKAKR